MRYVLLVAACLTAAVGAPAPAAAQDNGQVHVDPNSPAGREYDVPIARARREAAGRATEAADDSSVMPLFGKGIKRTSGGGPGRSAGSAPSAGNSTSGSGAKVPESGSARRNAVHSAGQPVASTPSDSPVLLPASAALCVLLAGALGAWVLRRGRKRHDAG